jgi:hypothetical protein
MSPSHERRRADQRASRARREAAIEARRVLIRQLWPTTSVLDIAGMLDMVPDAVNAQAAKLGLQRRPVRMQP